MIQCYALFWLCFSTVIFKAFLKQTATNSSDENTEQDEIDSLVKFFSGKAIIRQFLILSALIYTFDIAGMILVYDYTQLRPWQLGLFCLVAAAIVIDGLLDCHKLRELIRTKEADDLLSKLKLYMKPDTNPLGLSIAAIAAGGKVLLSLLLVLWTVFP